jgi:hypothetical protein
MLNTWKEKLLSLGGCLVLINSVLSTIHVYYLTLFKISAWVITKIDLIGKRFLWSDPELLRKKYHLVSWAIVCRPKDACGWGVLNLEQINIAFLCKWFWKCKYITEDDLWQSIIYFKYSDTSSLHFSAFWKAINYVFHFLLLDAKRVVDNGQSINFWIDN